MSTQKLPRPHVFTPPDLLIITNGAYQNHKRPLIGRYSVELVGRTPRDPINFFLDTPILPPNVRGVTRVTYVHAENYTGKLIRHVYGQGRAFLHTPDVFSEPFGVSLATVRAVTDLIESHQPINAGDIGIRIGRYLDDVIDIHGQTEEEQQILDRAADKLAEAIAKCQSSK